MIWKPTKQENDKVKIWKLLVKRTLFLKHKKWIVLSSIGIVDDFLLLYNTAEYSSQLS